MRRRYAFALAGWMLMSLPAQGFEPCDDTGKRVQSRHEADEWRGILAGKEFARLDAHFNRLIRESVAGRLSDAAVKRSFAAFENWGERNEPLLAEWLRLYPRSAAAHLAAAYLHAERGFAILDDAQVAPHSATQADAALRELRAALLALDNAERLEAGTSLVAAARIRVATARLIPMDAAALYRKAIKEHPQSIELRIQYIVASSPRKGGSFARLEEIAADVGALSPADQRYVRYLVYQEVGSAREAAGDLKGAGSQYEKSAPFCPGMEQAANKAMSAYERVRDFTGLVRVATATAERSRANAHALVMRAKGYRELARYREAIADLERAVELGDPAALEGLAWFYEQGVVVPRDIPRAIELYSMAALREVKGAREKADKLRAAGGRARS